MTRRKINKELYNRLLEIGEKYTIKELLPIINREFNENYKENDLRRYFFRNNLKYKYESEKKAHIDIGLPIGSERIKPDGMVQVKVAPRKWVYKQRLIYEQYHNVKLNEEQYVIFLDQNRNNFDISNLAVLSRKESGIMANQKLYSKLSNATKAGILIVRLQNKTKMKEEMLNGN